ncbi:hypothetical protein F4604DRAFT_1878403 [Suillus subluteus]|nr:hypothetical protein F4604DRAFT_1878403 [Suillus subluteus]
MVWHDREGKGLIPRERRKRISAHEPSAKLARRQFAVQENAVEAVEVGTAVEVSVRLIIYDKKLKSKTSPYSKVQRRRFNRRQREQVGGGLDDIGAVLSAIDTGDSLEQGSPVAEETKDARAHKVQPKTLQIGEGKGMPLKKNQRKRALELEKLRHPLILSNPQYSSNPFQTIRTHAQNTLVKRADVPNAQ